MDNPEKLVTLGAQDEDKQNKKRNKTRALLQRTEGKDVYNIFLIKRRNLDGDHTTRN